MYACSVVIRSIPACRLLASGYWAIVAVCWSSWLLSGVWRGHSLVAGSRSGNVSGYQEGIRGIRKSAGRGGLQMDPLAGSRLRFPSLIAAKYDHCSAGTRSVASCSARNSPPLSSTSTASTATTAPRLCGLEMLRQRLPEAFFNNCCRLLLQRGDLP